MRCSSKRLCGLSTALVVTVGSWAASDPDVILEVRRVPGTTRVKVVGSWPTVGTTAWNDGVTAWQWGLCHDSSKTSIGECIGRKDYAQGCPNLSVPPDMASVRAVFHYVNITPDGIGQAVMLDIGSRFELDARESFEMLEIEYSSLPCDAALTFCSTVPSENPERPLAIAVSVGASSVTPTTRNLPRTCEDIAFEVERVPGTTKVRVLGRWPNVGSTVWNDGVQGWSWGLCHDSSRMHIGTCLGRYDHAVGCPNVAKPSDMAGAAVDFHYVNISENGIVQAVMLDLDGHAELDAQDLFEMLQIQYDALPCDAELHFCSTLPSTNPDVPVALAVTVGGWSGTTSISPRTSDLARACEDVALRLEQIPGTTKVKVIGSWPNVGSNVAGDGVRGWSWGVCHNSAEARIGTCVGRYDYAAGCPNVAKPSDMADVAVDFHYVGITENGIVQAVMLDLDGGVELDNRESFEMLEIRYEILGCDTRQTELSFCSTLPSVNPDVRVANVVTVGTMSVSPTTTGLTLVAPAARLRLEQVPGTNKVRVVGSWPGIGTEAWNDGVTGWSWGVCHDPAGAGVGSCTGVYNYPSSTCPRVSLPPDMASLVTDFHYVKIMPEGIVQAVILDIETRGELDAQESFAMLEIEYDFLRADTHLEFCSTLPSVNEEVPVPVVISVGARSLCPQTEGLQVTCMPVHTGDANNSKAIDIADAICILGYLFGPTTDACKNPKCLANMDTNNSDVVDIADAVRVLSFLFAHGDMLAPSGSVIKAGGDGCKLYTKAGITLECAQPCTAK